MKICLFTGEIAPAPLENPPPAGVLHPGYFFPDAAAEERLGLNTVLQRLGIALDREPAEHAPGADVTALGELAARGLLCFAPPEGARLNAPEADSDALVPLDRDSLARNLALPLGFAPVAHPGLSPRAARLATALAGLPEPDRAFHWLLLHRFLPALADPATLEALGRAARAPLFDALDPGPAVPLEFALALLAACPPPAPAARLLALGYWLNIPTAQGVMTSLRQADAASGAAMPFLPRLERADLNRGDAGQVVVEHELHKRTPLWFYLIRERRLMGGGARLGPLGARLLAEGMMGLIQSVPGGIDPFAEPAAAPEGAEAALEA